MSERLRRLSHLFRDVTSGESGGKRVPWDLARCRERPPNYVFVDGLASEGSDSSPPILFRELRPVVASAAPEAHLCCLSWSRYGSAYAKHNTNRDLVGRWPRDLTAPYLRAASEKGITFIAFSVGCPLTVLGLSRQPDRLAAVRQVILVQPAFTVRESAATNLQSLVEAPEVRLALPQPAEQVIDPEYGFVQLIDTALQAVAQQTDVSVVYWADDPFLDFAGWAERRTAINVRSEPVSFDRSASLPAAPEDAAALDAWMLTEFFQHLRVPRLAGVKAAIARLVAEANSPAVDGLPETAREQ